jgi:hypothetical protein
MLRHNQRGNAAKALRTARRNSNARPYISRSSISASRIAGGMAA